MTLAILIAYLVGGALGWTSSRSDRLGRVWPTLVRAQLLAASATLALVAAWRLGALSDAVWPLLMVAVFAVIFAVSLLTTRGDGRWGRGTLRAWAANANSGFFAIPVAAALVGPSGALVATLVDRLGAPLWALFVYLLRRDAPRPQRFRTSWIDQSALIALLVGFGLRAVVSPPDWTLTLSQVAAPFMALTGAAIFVGSVLHSSQRIDPRPGVVPWVLLVGLRVALFLPIALVAPSQPVLVVAILLGLSIPSFGPAQFSTIYGFADPVVAAGARLGWVVGAVGLVVAVVMGT